MAIAFVRRVGAAANASSVAVTVTGVASGNHLTAGIRNVAAQALSTLADDKSNTWAAIRGPTATGNAEVNIYHAENVAAGDTIVTATFDASTNNGTLHVWEHSGVATSSSLDADNGATGNGETASVAVTTTQTGDAIVNFVATAATRTFSGDGDYTNLLTNLRAASQQRVFSSAAEDTVTATWTTADDWVSLIAAFKAAGAAPAAVYPSMLPLLGVGA